MRRVVEHGCRPHRAVAHGADEVVLGRVHHGSIREQTWALREPRHWPVKDRGLSLSVEPEALVQRETTGRLVSGACVSLGLWRQTACCRPRDDRGSLRCRALGAKCPWLVNPKGGL
jgi:hypothetical protein